MNLYPVIILAGGLATRLRPVTEKIPKALVQVGGKPFIEQQLKLLRSHNFKKIIISAWYRGGMIREYLGDGGKLELDIEYVFDGQTPLGTGGAIKKASNLISTPFFVLYGDSYLPCDYESIQTYFAKQASLGLMTTFLNRGKWDASNVEMNAGRILNYDKRDRTPQMKYIDYGLGIFLPDVFDDVKEGQYADLADIYRELIEKDQLLAYEVKERFYEIGSLEGLQELDALLSEDPDQFLKKGKK